MKRFILLFVACLFTLLVSGQCTISLSSAVGTDSQVVCIDSPIDSITYATTGATGATFLGLPNGVTGTWRNDSIIVKGTPVAAGTYTFAITLIDTCEQDVTTTGTIIVSPLHTIFLTSGASTPAQTVCINTSIANITYTTTGATGATVSGLPNGVNGNWIDSIITINGTPAEPGSFTYTITLTGGCGSNITTNGTIKVERSNTILQAGSNNQTVCINSPISNITYTTSCATNVSFSGLPTGVFGFWMNNTITIIGTPDTTGIFDYTVIISGIDVPDTVTGTIVVKPAIATTLISGDNSNHQTLCVDSAIATIQYYSPGATNAQVLGLPSGINWNWDSANNLVTISGTPTASAGTFSFVVISTGDCGSTIETGSITVITSNTIRLLSGSKAISICINTPIVSIHYAIQGTNQYTITGLPAGLTPVLHQDTLTISGTPTVGGNFSYKIKLLGGCGNAIDSGTIHVVSANSIALSSGDSNQQICLGKGIDTITYTTTGATGANISGLPNGVVGVWQSNKFTISGTPTNVGIFNYTIRTSGGCDTVIANGTITITTIINTISLTSSSGSDAQTICAKSSLDTITYATTGDRAATVSNLPTGLSFSVGDNKVKIYGSPNTTDTIPKLYDYKVELTEGCGIISKSGTIRVLPSPNAIASPPTQTICSSDTIYTIQISGNTPGSVFHWTRNNTVNITGIGPGGAGNISGTLTNSNAAPDTVTFTIRPLFTYDLVTCIGDTMLSTVIVNPIPNATPGRFIQAICSGSSFDTIFITGNVAGTVYNWEKQVNPDLAGMATNGSGHIAGAFTNTSYEPDTGVFTITPIFKSCTGETAIAAVIVNPLPNAVVSHPSQFICSGSQVNTIASTGNVAGTVFNWIRHNTANLQGMATTGSGNIDGVLSNDSTHPRTDTFSIIPVFTHAGKSCIGVTERATVMVSPLPKAVVVPGTQTICSGDTVVPIILTSLSPDTAFNWVRNNVSVTGIPGTGDRNIAGVLRNDSSYPVPVIFTITPAYTGGNVSCYGKTDSAIVIVNPIPDAIATPGTQSICSGSIIQTIELSSRVSNNVTYHWTRDNAATVTGMADSGSGNISGTLINSGTQPILVTFTFSPRFSNGGVICTGGSIKATVLVFPIPKTHHVSNLIVCNRDTVSRINFTTDSPNPLFTWTSSPAIGFGSNGSGYIPFFEASNPGNIPLTTTVTVNVKANNCPGRDTTFQITVNPAPAKPAFKSLSAIADTDTLQLCEGTGNVNFNVTNPDTNNAYAWFTSTPGIAIRDYNDAHTVISFPQRGFYAVSVKATNNAYSCSDTVTQLIHVVPLAGIEERKIILKQPGNLLIYPDNSLNPANGYQWGYDSLIRSSPDSGFSAPIPFPGQVYQYMVPQQRFIVNDQLETSKYAYWVLLRSGTCFTRVYYNGPYANLRMRPVDPEPDEIVLRIFPSPNSGNFTIALSGNMYGTMQSSIYNALGELIFNSRFPKTTPAITERINTRNLPNGLYYLIITGSDLKKVKAPFIIPR